MLRRWGVLAVLALFLIPRPASAEPHAAVVEGERILVGSVQIYNDQDVDVGTLAFAVHAQASVVTENGLNTGNWFEIAAFVPWQDFARRRGTLAPEDIDLRPGGSVTLRLGALGRVTMHIQGSEPDFTPVSCVGMGMSTGVDGWRLASSFSTPQFTNVTGSFHNHRIDGRYPGSDFPPFVFMGTQAETRVVSGPGTASIPGITCLF